MKTNTGKSHGFVLPARGSFSYLTPQKNASKESTGRTGSSRKMTSDREARNSSPEKLRERRDSRVDPKLINWGFHPNDDRFQTAQEKDFPAPRSHTYYSPREYFAPTGTGLSVNLIPKEEPQIRIGKRLSPRRVQQEWMPTADSPGKEFKPRKRVLDELKFTPNPLLKEHKDFRYHIIMPDTIKKHPLWEPAIHKHVKQIVENQHPDWFDHQEREAHEVLDSDYKNTIISPCNQTAAYVNRVSFQNRFPRDASKRISGLSPTKNPDEDMAALLRHDYLYSPSSSQSPRRKQSVPNEIKRPELQIGSSPRRLRNQETFPSRPETERGFSSNRLSSERRFTSPKNDRIVHQSGILQLKLANEKRTGAQTARNHDSNRRLSMF